uniref:Activin_recp domain-containing protein n=1 Tax=Parastrongyloides trichosuri TaxID=131310 RepID=A0A0N5A3S2_PARTI
MSFSNERSMLLRYFYISSSFNVIPLGYLSVPNGIQQFETVTCKEDLKQNWCSVVFNPQMEVSEYNCFNLYSYNIFSGIPQCGDLPGEIQDSGCKTIKKMDGTDCIYCCCKGTLCNDPSVFMNIASRQNPFSTYNSSSNLGTNSIILIILMHFYAYLK